MRSIRQKFSVAILFLLGIASLTLGARVTPAFAQSETVSESDVGTLKEDVEGIKADLEEIKKELKLIRQFLSQRLAQRSFVRPSKVSWERIEGMNPRALLALWRTRRTKMCGLPVDMLQSVAYICIAT